LCLPIQRKVFAAGRESFSSKLKSSGVEGPIGFADVTDSSVRNPMALESPFGDQGAAAHIATTAP
jgi:hypothetical protein